MKDPVKTGSLYHVSDVKEQIVKDDEWFTEHIVVQGDMITVKVNDKQTVQWTQPKEWAGSPDLPAGYLGGHGRAAGARSEQHGLLQEHPHQATVALGRGSLLTFRGSLSAARCCCYTLPCGRQDWFNLDISIMDMI